MRLSTVSVFLFAPAVTVTAVKHAFLRRGSSRQGQESILSSEDDSEGSCKVPSFLSPPDSKGAWARTCKEMSGLISPYYAPEKDGETRVVCVPAMCGEEFVGRSSDIATQKVGQSSNNAVPKCMQKKMGDSCCTDKVKSDTTCFKGGALPCSFGSVTSLQAYTQAAVETFDGQKAAGVQSDCQGKAGGSGPEEDWNRDSGVAMGSMPESTRK